MYSKWSRGHYDLSLSPSLRLFVSNNMEWRPLMLVLGIFFRERSIKVSTPLLLYTRNKMWMVMAFHFIFISLHLWRLCSDFYCFFYLLFSHFRSLNTILLHCNVRNLLISQWQIVMLDIVSVVVVQELEHREIIAIGQCCLILLKKSKKVFHCRAALVNGEPLNFIVVKYFPPSEYKITILLQQQVPDICLVETPKPENMHFHLS